MSSQHVYVSVMLGVVPKLWAETIETHRREVHAAILDTTAALVAEHGLPSVTMSQIAEETGIGRATLYKYFPDVEAILVAWHDQHVEGHLKYLTEIRDSSGDAGERIETVLEAYALITYERSQKHGGADATAHGHRGDHTGRSHKHHGSEIGALVHRDEHVRLAQRRLNDFFGDLLVEGAKTGYVRDDVATEELASYCVRALGAAGDLRSKPAVRRLVAVTLSGLRPHR